MTNIFFSMLTYASFLGEETYFVSRGEIENDAVLGIKICQKK
jgi:hypothetical protein